MPHLLLIYPRVTCVILARSKVARSIHAMILYIVYWTSDITYKRKNHFGSCCEGWWWCSWWRESCWYIPKFHSWGKCTVILTNINSDWTSKALSGLLYMGLTTFTFHFPCHMTHLVGGAAWCRVKAAVRDTPHSHKWCLSLFKGEKKKG